jgi:hypothetical protein
MPRIWVCTAPDDHTVQRSLLIEVMAGATAVGGGDLTVVVLSLILCDREFELEFVVDSVTMVWASDGADRTATMAAMNIFIDIVELLSDDVFTACD